jgi:hypothetical protein
MPGFDELEVSERTALAKDGENDVFVPSDWAREIRVSADSERAVINEVR